MANATFSDIRTNQTFHLEDGRVLGFAEYGPVDGRPVFHFHGLPGCRYGGKSFEYAAFEHNARIICIDRPGIGLSSPQPGRTALDLAHDVQALALHLQLDNFSILGESGGGPYALACAHVIPLTQLTGVTLVAGAGPWDPDNAKGETAMNRWLFWGLNTAPMTTSIIVRLMFGSMLLLSDKTLRNKAQSQLDGSSETNSTSSQKDKEALADGETNWRLIKETREHFRQGYSAFCEDGKILSSELGFDPSDIKCEELSLWYGKQDVNVLASTGEEYARRLGGRATLKIVDETHLSIVKNYAGEILRDLLKTRDSTPSFEPLDLPLDQSQHH